MAAVPHSFNAVWDRALLLRPLLEILCDQTLSEADKKNTASPFCLDPRGLEPSVTPLPTNRRGISPAAPTLGRDVTSGIRSLSRRGYLLRARERGPAWV